MEKALKEKLERVVELVNNVMVNPDIEVECCRTGVETSEAGDPYIHLKYMANGTHVMEQNIPLKHHYIEKTAEDIANLVTFYIEQFMEQIDSVESGAQ
ncbi:MAG: hypothetical protein HKP62_05685 [Sulfurovum sp.]|nr:hypothetical protein [Sulfurovum sp.]NNJ45488.1 hypothetical protein [Sulfurovum sp.]